MASNISDLANLNIATKWNKDGDPIEFRTMTADDFKLASSRAVEIATMMVEIVSGD